MFTRTASLLIVIAWLVSMGFIFVKDVLPQWSAQDLPEIKATDWLCDEGSNSQYIITTPNGRLGRVWTSYRISEEAMQREDLAVIEGQLLKANLFIPPMRIKVESVYKLGVLDELTLRVNLPGKQKFRMHGERFHSDFSFQYDGPGVEDQQNFRLPLSEAGMISGAFSPFSQLPDLEVGQTWRMQVLNPISFVFPASPRFLPLLIKVERMQSIDTSEGYHPDLLVLKADNVTAWVDDQGIVHRQQVELPLLGKDHLITIEREAYDEHLRARADRRSLQETGSP